LWINISCHSYLWMEISRRLKWKTQLQLPKYRTTNHNILSLVQSLETYNSVCHRNCQFFSPQASTTQIRNQLFLHSVTHRGEYFQVLCLYGKLSFRAYMLFLRWSAWRSSLHYSWKVNFFSWFLRNCKDYCYQNTPWLSLAKIQNNNKKGLPCRNRSNNQKKGLTLETVSMTWMRRIILGLFILDRMLISLLIFLNLFGSESLNFS